MKPIVLVGKRVLLAAIVLQMQLLLAQDDNSQSLGAMRNRVYVTEFDNLSNTATESGTVPINPHDVAQLSSALVRIKLQEVPQLDVVALGKNQSAVCASKPDQVSVQSATEQAGVRSQRRVSSPSDIMPNGSFLVSGSITVHSENIEGNYKVQRCTGGVLNELTTLPLLLSADRSAFSAQVLLEKLDSITDAVSLSLENPPLSVSIAQFSPKGDASADRISRLLRRAISGSGGLMLTEKNKGWDYRVTGTVTSVGTELHVSIRLLSNREDQLPEIPLISDKVRRELERRVVQEVLTTLDDVRLADRFSVSTLTQLSSEELMKLGKKLLCQDQVDTCRQDPSAAERIFQVAKTKNQSQWELSYLLGVAQSADYKYTEALASMEEALKRISAMSSPAIADKAKVQVLNSLGDLHSTRGDIEGSIAKYAASLNINPHQPNIVLKKAESQFASNRVEGMQTLLDGVGENPTDSDLSSALVENVRKLQEQDYAKVEPRFKQALVAGAPIRDSYALLWTLWAETTGAYANLDQQEQYLANARKLEPASTDVQAEILGLTASINLPGNLEEADKNLKQAEIMPSEKIGSATLAWLARLRAIYYLDRKDYAAASEHADQAQQIDSSYDSDLVAVNAANGWALDLSGKDPQDHQAQALFKKAHDLVLPLAEYRFDGADSALSTANHGLKADKESVTFFQRILKGSPGDFSARLSLTFVCNEYIFDTECSFRQSQALLSHLEGLSAYDRTAMQLNAIEAAVLNRKYEAATALFHKVKLAEEDTSLQAVADFYKLWIAFANKKKEDAKTDFENLLKSLPAYAKNSQQPDSELSRWSFKGAQHALHASELSPAKQKLLGDVIQALDNPSQDIGSLELPADL